MCPHIHIYKVLGCFQSLEQNFLYSRKKINKKDCYNRTIMLVLYFERKFEQIGTSTENSRKKLYKMNENFEYFGTICRPLVP